MIESSTTSEPYLNIAAYRFVQLDPDGLPDLRQDLLQRCTREWHLLGTILLAPEGINLFLAGRPENIESFWAYITSMPAFEELTRKDSFSQTKPFNRMLVKLKKEIIPMRDPSIDPERTTVPRVSPSELKHWLDEGRDVVLLDTRNGFEVELGTFEGAVHWNLDHFHDFPKAVEDADEDLRRKRVVTFCTGGIRCEKAGPLMRQNGFEDVYQLDGGILRWFEDIGGDYYDGECFVFDHRVAVDCGLRETGTTQCFACRHVLTKVDQESPTYILGTQCPYCAQSGERIDRCEV